MGLRYVLAFSFPLNFWLITVAEKWFSLEVKHSNNWAGAPYYSNPQGWSWIQAFIKSHQLTPFLQNLGNFLAFSCFDKEFGGSTFLTACGLRCSSKDRNGKNSQKLDKRHIRSLKIRTFLINYIIYKTKATKICWWVFATFCPHCCIWCTALILHTSYFYFLFWDKSIRFND